MKQTGQAIGLSLLAATLALSHARADVPLPWLSDPFSVEKKAAGYGAGLRPESCPAAPNLDRPLTVAQVVVTSLCHNPTTRASYLSLLAQADTYGTSYSGYLPTVTATAGATRAQTFGNHSKTETVSNGTGISAAMTLFDFGQRELSIESAEMGLIAAGHSYDSTLQGAIAAALQGYYRLLTSQNAVGVARESELFAKESFDAAKLKHDIGLVPLADELQARGSYSQALLASQQADNQLAQDQGALALLMGLPPDAPVAVAEMEDVNLKVDPFGGEVKALMDKAKEKRKDLLASRAQLKGAETSLESLKRSHLATVTAGVNAGYDDLNVASSGTGRSQSIGINVSIPIFSGFSNQYSERAAEKQLSAQKEQLVQTELSVEQDVWRAWQNYQTAKLSWDTSQDQLASATQLKNVAIGRYKEGLGTILDVLSAQNAYSSALQSQLTTRYNLLTTRVDLVRAVGVLDLNTMQPEATADAPAIPETPMPGQY